MHADENTLMETNPYEPPRHAPQHPDKSKRVAWFLNPWHPATLCAVLVGICLSLLLVLLAGVIHGL